MRPTLAGPVKDARSVDGGEEGEVLAPTNWCESRVAAANWVEILAGILKKDCLARSKIAPWFFRLTSKNICLEVRMGDIREHIHKTGEELTNLRKICYHTKGGMRTEPE